MKLLFMKTSYSQLPFTLERQMIKTGLLFGETITTLTPTLNGLGVYHNRALASDKQVINNYKYFFTNLGVGFSADELDLFFNNLVMLRSKKFKTRDDLINHGKMEQNIHLLKSEIDRANIHWMKTYKLDSILNFYADETLNVYDESSELRVDENFYQNFLMDEIIDPEMFHFFGSHEAINMHQPRENPEFIEDFHIRLFSSVLFEIPCLDSFSYTQLKIIRNEFQEHLKPFIKAIEDMKSKFETYILTEANIVSVSKEFDEIVDPYIEFFKDFIGNNIYFQQIANSSTDHKMYQLNICFASLKTLLALYENAYVIDDVDESTLLEKIALTKDLNNGIVFFEMAEIPTV